MTSEGRLRAAQRGLVIAVALGATLFAGLSYRAMAQNAPAAQPSRADQLVQYRRAMLTVMAANFAPLGNMAPGKAPWDPKDFTLRAQRVQMIATALPEGFVPESKAGANTNAKPELWAERPEFERLLRNLQSRVGELSAAVQSGNADQMKSRVGPVGEACKACHDKYRNR
jgi:cytochrome c556